MDTILNQIRESASNVKDMFNLVDKQDLYNIQRDFGLYDGRFDNNDFLSVARHIKFMSYETDNPILYFRSPSTQSEAESRQTSMLVVIATPFQLQSLATHGKNGTICMDSTHGTAGYGYLLTSIVVVDDFGNGVPVAFCLSSNSSEAEWKTFLEEVKKAISKLYGGDGRIKAKTLMTDMDNSFYNAWVDVMGDVQYRLYCSWHVDQAWRRNLGKVFGFILYLIFSYF